MLFVLTGLEIEFFVSHLHDLFFVLVDFFLLLILLFDEGGKFFFFFFDVEILGIQALLNEHQVIFTRGNFWRQIIRQLLVMFDFVIAVQDKLFLVFAMFLSLF